MKENRTIAKKFMTAAAAVLIVFVAAASSITIIPTGYTGVRTTFGQVSAKPVNSGLNLKIPFIQSIERVNNKQQDIVFGGQIWSETRQRTAIYYADVTVTYQINPERSAWIYANVSNYRDALVSQSLVASGIKASSKELNDTDATNRSIIEPAAMTNIQASLDEKYGEGVVYINKVVIGNADFDDSYNAAIASKQKAQVEAEQQAIENQRAIEKAEAEAKVLKTTAQAQADAKVIAAQAEADANKLIEESLNEKILRSMYLEKWDGVLPRFVGSGDSQILIGLDDGGIEGSTDKE